ncbi:MAG: N-acetylmuramoyl-L-alanine amidase [Bacteroidales bacterium]|nr:N-acetylmuramoyl-L-alanine amidase [Candidatus Cryptobacteroides equifaecalis]
MKRTICILIGLALSLNCLADRGLGLNSVVIDAGHGGKDAGAVSKDRKYYEKTFTLDISKKLAEKISSSYPEVKVILTRDKDEFVSLQDRASLANQADAQLFISVHINSTGKTSPNGFSVHVLGQSSQKDRDLFAYNMDVCKRENSVIMLEDDYTAKYEGFDPSDTESYIFMTLMQNANLEQSLKFAQQIQKNLKGGPIVADRGLWQDPFYLLWKTSMPAVLVELGFISNDSDLAVLKDPAGRNRIVERLFKAFCEYKRSYDASVGAVPATEPELVQLSHPEQERQSEVGVTPAQAKDPDGLRYGIQVAATRKKISSGDPLLMGQKAEVIDCGTVLKYIIYVSEDLSEVKGKLARVRKKTPDAFIVRIEGNKVSIQR